MRKFCKHISFDDVERKFLVREPAVLEPVMTADSKMESMRCSKCNTKVPILYRVDNRIGIKLIPK